MPNINIDIYARLHNAEKQIADLDKKLDGMGKTATTGDSKLKGLWKQVAAGVIAVGGLQAAIRGARGLVGSFMDVARETETYKLRLKALLGSQDKASEAMKFFQKTAASLPFTLQDVIKSGTRLATIKVPFKDWLPRIADLAAKIGMDLPTATDQMARALSAGLGAADIFRDEGVTPMIQAFAKEKYHIDNLSKVALPDLQKVLFEFLKSHEGGAKELAGSWDGMTSMLEDAWFQFRQAVMDAGVFDYLKAGLKDVLDWINRMKETGKLQEWAEKTAGAIITLFKALGTMKDVLEALAKGGYIGAFDEMARKITGVSEDLKNLEAEMIQKAIDFKDSLQALKPSMEDIRVEFEKGEKHREAWIAQMKEIDARLIANKDKYAELGAQIFGYLGIKTQEKGKVDDTDESLKKYNATLDDTKKKIGNLKVVFDPLVQNFLTAHKEYTEGKITLTEYIGKIRDAREEVKRFTNEWETLPPAIEDAEYYLEDMGDTTDSVLASIGLSLQGLKRDVKDVTDATKKEVSEQKKIWLDFFNDLSQGLATVFVDYLNITEAITYQAKEFDDSYFQAKLEGIKETYEAQKEGLENELDLIKNKTNRAIREIDREYDYKERQVERAIKAVERETQVALKELEKIMRIQERELEKEFRLVERSLDKEGRRKKHAWDKEGRDIKHRYSAAEREIDRDYERKKAAIMANIKDATEREAALKALDQERTAALRKARADQREEEKAHKQALRELEKEQRQRERELEKQKRIRQRELAKEQRIRQREILKNERLQKKAHEKKLLEFEKARHKAIRELNKALRLSTKALQESLVGLEEWHQTKSEQIRTEEDAARIAHAAAEEARQKSLWNKVKTVFGNAVSSMLTTWTEKFINKAINKVTDWLIPKFDKVTNAGEKVAKSLLGKASIGGALKDIGGMVKNLGKTLSNLASGGMTGVISGAVSGLISGLFGPKGLSKAGMNEHLYRIHDRLQEIKDFMFIDFRTYILQGWTIMFGNHHNDVMNKFTSLQLLGQNRNTELRTIRRVIKDQILGHVKSQATNLNKLYKLFSANIKFGQHGLDTMVSRPTMFMAGERGPEHVTVTPQGGAGPRMPNQVNVTFQINAVDSEGVRRMLETKGVKVLENMFRMNIGGITQRLTAEIRKY